MQGHHEHGPCRSLRQGDAEGCRLATHRVLTWRLTANAPRAEPMNGDGVDADSCRRSHSNGLLCQLDIRRLWRIGQGMAMSQTPPSCPFKLTAGEIQSGACSGLLGDVSKHILSICVKLARVIGRKVRSPWYFQAGRKRLWLSFSPEGPSCSDV